MKKRTGIKQAIIDACDAAGSQLALAKALKLKSQGAVANWLLRGQIPSEHVLKIESLTGVSRHRLRPDIYPEDL